MVNPMARGPQPARSVRIDHEVDERLRKLASEQGVSVNALATRSLRRYAEWDAFADKFGFVDMPASIFYRMLDGLSEEQLRTLGRWAGGTLLKEYITFWFKEVRLDTLLEGCPRLIAKYGRLFEYEEHDERGQRTLVLKHAAGPKASIFYEQLLRSAFEELLRQPVTIERSESQVVARFFAPGLDAGKVRTEPFGRSASAAASREVAP